MTQRDALTAADAARRTALEDCELRIHSALRRGLDATCEIAKQLDRILQGELFQARGLTDFRAYVTDFLPIDWRTCRRIVVIAETIERLKDAGLSLPLNETQAAELARLEPERRAAVWSRLISRFSADDRKLTVEAVRIAVDEDERQRAQLKAETEKPREIEVAMEEDIGSDGEEPQPKKKTSPGPPSAVRILTEKGEAALERIRRVCGDNVARDLASGRVALGERELRAWAELSEAAMRTLVYYVMDERWSVNKALAFEERGVRPETDVGELIWMAKARGGSALVNYDNQATIAITLDT